MHKRAAKPSHLINSQHVAASLCKIRKVLKQAGCQDLYLIACLTSYSLLQTEVHTLFIACLAWLFASGVLSITLKKRKEGRKEEGRRNPFPDDYKELLQLSSALKSLWF